MRNVYKLFGSSPLTFAALVIATVSLTLPIALDISAKKKKEAESNDFIKIVYEQNSKLSMQVESLSKRILSLEKEINSNKVRMESLDNSLSFQADVIKNLLNKKGADK